jgi:hypothetical protein
VHVAIDGHGLVNLAIALHAADGDGDIVDHAEAFAVIGERVMESSADADRHAVVERVIGGQHRAAGGEPEALLPTPASTGLRVPILRAR